MAPDPGHGPSRLLYAYSPGKGTVFSDTGELPALRRPHAAELDDIFLQVITAFVMLSEIQPLRLSFRRYPQANQRLG